jgi:hypothetical protein
MELRIADTLTDSLARLTGGAFRSGANAITLREH